MIDQTTSANTETLELGSTAKEHDGLAVNDMLPEQ